MKKGKITVTITIAIACFALCMIMFMQFKIVRETDITSIENMKKEELRAELVSWKEKYKEAEEQCQEKNEQLLEYKNKEKSDAETAQLIQEQQKQTEMYLGTTDVQGEGITITLKDSREEPITADDLLIIVDYLKSAGAEAISINNERIINMTDIVYVNNSVIYINQQRILAPYEIKAIGNQIYLESILLGNGGYVDQLKKWDYEVTIQKSDKPITINKYNREINSRYLN